MVSGSSGLNGRSGIGEAGGESPADESRLPPEGDGDADDGSLGCLGDAMAARRVLLFLDLRVL